MRVLLATKDQNLRISLQLLVSEEPGMRVVGTASETNGLRALIKTTNPDLVIVDWDLPGRKVGELLEEAGKDGKASKFIVLGKDSEDKKSAIDFGAGDFVLKAAPPDYLLKAIYRTLAHSNSKTEEKKVRNSNQKSPKSTTY